MPERAKIVELVDRLTRIAHSIQFAGGLNPAQWEALRFVARANRNSCTPGLLADFMGLTKGTVSQTLKALESKGLIERHPKCEDRRSVHILVTAKGNTVLENDPLGRISEALGPCHEFEQAQVLTAMERLLSAVQSFQEVPEFGPCLNCAHYQPEQCAETNSMGCRCGISGELFSSLELDKICSDFSPLR
ncbi:MAG: MarR family transcriptional regulator [Pseudomonadota bacterium]|nr:MarR family transcriptional regulator [Pseudomonadota bacterium]